MTLPPECRGCPREGEALTYTPPDPITDITRIVIFGEMPGAAEAKQGRGFVGPAGRKLREACRRAGLSCWSAWPNSHDPGRGREEIACFNAVRCRAGDNVVRVAQFPVMRFVSLYRNVTLAVPTH